VLTAGHRSTEVRPHVLMAIINTVYSAQKGEVEQVLEDLAGSSENR
jgi:hypothetical protein